MVVIDSVVRLLPDALGNIQSAPQDSFSTGLLEYPHYTRPRDFRGMTVPDVLLSGNHAQINAWRRKESLRRTYERRKDLLDEQTLTAKDCGMLLDIKYFYYLISFFVTISRGIFRYSSKEDKISVKSLLKSAVRL